MEKNKEVRRDDHSDESCSYSDESWPYERTMCCPYMHSCPYYLQMTQYTSVKISRDGANNEENADQDDDMRNPRRRRRRRRRRPYYYYRPYPYYYHRPYPYYPYPYYMGESD